uniref:PX domain-containing protein n=1 Tax=Octactis speculum TaxID=3111310 RepID=A0A7S2DRY2_9STRA|mmetsp:Transcript_53102/g.72523  ORF Transcript_53102/g.72523 Transcript_53102/m.72523 type:complete len:226 (+) Transcript_53102:1-678(+)|eukprot:CAMPEP_0185778682 /NCGR_PEP_ID=MMETSP1174-20130828/93244_1 /TAXON_ID=35687 /ORGANISM="Dictyocha speculum, Strain CCMP1381" /LENGTH=225 /DNA_ID=CAMNT_0028467491 /DNA_START=1 /DNA_END=678 /DNA_ORIENTATION=-
MTHQQGLAQTSDLMAPLEDVVWRKLYITSDMAAMTHQQGYPKEREFSQPGAVTSSRSIHDGFETSFYRQRVQSSTVKCIHGIGVGFCGHSGCTEVVTAGILGVHKRSTDGVFEFELKVYLRPTTIGRRDQNVNDGCDLTLWHRYSAFHSLNQRLVDAFGTDAVPQFPGKKLNQLTCPMREVATKRVSKLNRFIQGIMVSDRLRNCDDFKCFVSADKQARSIFYQE